MEKVGSGSDWVDGLGFGLVVVQDGILVAVLLVCEANCDGVGRQEGGQWGFAAKLVLAAPEAHVLLAEGNRAFGRGAGGLGVFADAEQEEESEYYEVAGDG